MGRGGIDWDNVLAYQTIKVCEENQFYDSLCHKK